MKTQIRSKNNKGQTAVEYMILLGAVAAVVLLGFWNYIPRINTSANTLFNQTAMGVYGAPNRCGDGVCAPRFEDSDRCPADCTGGGGGPPPPPPTCTPCPNPCPLHGGYNGCSWCQGHWCAAVP